MTSRIGPCLVLSLVLAACEVEVAPPAAERAEAPAEPAEGEVPFELAGPQEAVMIVQAHVNGQGPYDLVFDTGATVTCLSATVEAELELPEREGVRGVGAGVGGAGEVRLVTIDSLRVGPASVEGTTGCVLDLAHMQGRGVDIHGLLGLDFLTEFRVEIDWERSVVRLTRE